MEVCHLLRSPGVAPTLRHLAALEKPVISIRANGTHLSIKTESSFKTTEISFELEKEFEETTADNRKVKVRPKSSRRCRTRRKLEGGRGRHGLSQLITKSAGACFVH